MEIILSRVNAKEGLVKLNVSVVEVNVGCAEQKLVRASRMCVTQVKNLRSQVGRAAVHVMAALFEQVLLTFATNLTDL